MNKEEAAIHILLVEDSDIDADLVRGHLDKGDIDYSMRRVSKRADLLTSLDEGGFDIVVTDYALPDLDGLEVTTLVRERHEDLPVVVVSGVQGEDFATAAFRRGAVDYVLKRTLGRLPNVVLRALRDARERTHRRTLENLNREQQEQYRSVFEASSDAIIIFELDGTIVQANPAACRIHGYDYNDLIGRCGRELVHPLDRENFDRFLNAVKAGQTFRAPAMHLSRTGDHVYVGIHGSRLTYRGKPQALAVMRDITQQKHDQEQQALLVRELSHRVKNTLATVQSIINFTLRTNDTLETFEEAIDSRIASLAKSHNLLTDNKWKGASLIQLLRNELDHYDTGGRIRLQGPDLDLPADMALVIGMVLHEMTTNAAKHGALLTEKGTVTVLWTVGRELDASRLALSWTERGGPPVVVPTRRGFGSILLGRLVANQLKGNVDLNYAPEGVELSLSAIVPDSVPMFDGAYRRRDEN